MKMFAIVPAKMQEVTKIACPECGEKIPRIGIAKDSTIKGLAFKCRKCGKFWEIKTK